MSVIVAAHFHRYSGEVAPRHQLFFRNGADCITYSIPSAFCIVECRLRVDPRQSADRGRRGPSGLDTYRLALSLEPEAKVDDQASVTGKTPRLAASRRVFSACWDLLILSV